MTEYINAPNTNLFPTTKIPWLIFFLALPILLISILAHLRMWQVELGLRPVAAGGGEYMVALFYGLPSLLIASTLMGISVVKTHWRSRLSIAIFTLSLAIIYGWLFTILGGLVFTVTLVFQSLFLLIKQWRPYAAIVFSITPLLCAWGWYLWMISPEIKFLLR